MSTCGSLATMRLLSLAQVLPGWFLAHYVHIKKKKKYLRHMLLESMVGTINHCVFYLTHFTLSWIPSNVSGKSLSLLWVILGLCLTAVTYPIFQPWQQYVAKCPKKEIQPCTAKCTKTYIKGFIRITFLYLSITQSQRKKGNWSLSAPIK